MAELTSSSYLYNDVWPSGEDGLHKLVDDLFVGRALQPLMTDAHICSKTKGLVRRSATIGR